MESADQDEDPSLTLDLSFIDCSPDDSLMVQNLLTNEGDYAGRRLSTNIDVPGNPHKLKFRSFWENDLKPSTFVLQTIQDGYKLPFSQIPPSSFEKKQQVGQGGQDFCYS